MSSSKRFEDKGGATVSRRALVGVAGATAATLVASRAFAQVPAAPPADDMFAKLRQLAELKDQGILTEQEFAAQKAKTLAS